MPNSFCLRVAASACLAALAACTTGPDFRPPQSDTLIASFVQPGPGRTVAQPFDAAWWELFSDPTLAELEQEALAANLDLQTAAARVQQSRAALQVSGAALLPSAAANASGLRERASEEGRLARADAAPYSVWQYGLDARWELDLWGRARRMRESAVAQEQASQFDAQAVRVAVGAEVARVYLELRGVQSQLRIARSHAEVAALSLHVAERRRGLGVATGFDTALSAGQRAAVEAAIPGLEQRRDALMNALALLLASPPHALDARLAQAAEVPRLPAEVPVGLPSELARRRPDILSAQARLHAATAEIGVARADFYPSIELTGSAGFQSLSFARLGDWGARQFAAGGLLHLPIFSGGLLKGKLALAEARQQEAALGFQGTVLAAWHEVDNALSAYRAAQRRTQWLDAALAQNRQALVHAERRYAQGAADYLSVLVTQQRLLDSDNAAARARTDEALAMVALYKALGGGWQPGGAH